MIQVAQARYEEAQASLNSMTARMENIGFVTERLQLVMDMGIVVAEVSNLLLVSSLGFVSNVFQGQFDRES